MPNPLFNALGGGQPSAVQQPSAPPSPGSPGVGGGSLYQALQGTDMQKGQNSLNAAFGNPPVAKPAQQPGLNPFPNDYEKKANAVMDAKHAQAMQEHPEWFK